VGGVETRTKTRDGRKVPFPGTLLLTNLKAPIHDSQNLFRRGQGRDALRRFLDSRATRFPCGSGDLSSSSSVGGQCTTKWFITRPKLWMPWESRCSGSNFRGGRPERWLARQRARRAGRCAGGVSDYLAAQFPGVPALLAGFSSEVSWAFEWLPHARQRIDGIGIPVNSAICLFCGLPQTRSCSFHGAM